MNPMIVCIIIFACSIVCYALNLFPMAITALLTMAALILTNCLDGATALAGFSNTNTVIICGMFVVSAALGKTSFVDKLSAWVIRISGGSFKKAWLGYIILAVLLTNFVTSPMVAFAIVCPLCNQMCKSYKVSPSKVMFALVVVCIGCCAILPFGYSITATGQYNGYLEAYNFTGIAIQATDFTKARWPMLLIIPAWAYLIAPKIAPDQPIIPIAGEIGSGSEKKSLKPLADKAGVIIFFITIILLIFNSQIGIAPWKVCLVAGAMEVVFGVLSEREAILSMNLSVAFIYSGALALANALQATGAGEVVGGWLSSAVGGTHNNYILGALFFIIPFILTQFMLNQGVMNIFVPICLLTCQSLGGNPVGLMILVTAGCLTAFLTPLATPAIPMCMGAGGYDIKSLFKQGWLISVVLMVCYVIYMMTVMPAF